MILILNMSRVLANVEAADLDLFVSIEDSLCSSESGTMKCGILFL